MRHEVLSCLLRRKGICEFFVLLDDRPEDISEFMYGQRFPKDHLVQGFWHSSKHDLVTAHQSSIQKFVHQRKLRSFPAEDVLSDGIDEDRRDLVPDFGVVLQERIGVSVQSVLIGSLGGKGVIDEHIHREQIDHCLFPSNGPMRIDQLHSVQTIILHLTHCAFVGHEPLPRHVFLRIDLQEHEVDTSTDQALHLVQFDIRIFNLTGLPGDSNQLHFVDEVDVSLVGKWQRFQGSCSCCLRAVRFSLVEEVVLRGNSPEELPDFKRQLHQLSIIRRC